jgi:hypothetical protein
MVKKLLRISSKRLVSKKKINKRQVNKRQVNKRQFSKKKIYNQKGGTIMEIIKQKLKDLSNSEKQESYEHIYYILWTIKNMNSLEYIETEFHEFIDILRRNYPNFDPTFSRYSNEQSKIFEKTPEPNLNPGTNPDDTHYNIPSDEQVVMIVGGILKKYYKKLQTHIYTVNISRYDFLINEDEPYIDFDLLYDINESNFFYKNPENFYQKFNMIIMESVPLECFLSQNFFKLAAFLLKSKDDAKINNEEYYNYNTPEPNYNTPKPNYNTPVIITNPLYYEKGDSYYTHTPYNLTFSKISELCKPYFSLVQVRNINYIRKKAESGLIFTKIMDLKI